MSHLDMSQFQTFFLNSGLCGCVQLLCILCTRVRPQSIWRYYHEDVFTPVRHWIKLDMVKSLILHTLETPQPPLTEIKPKWSYSEKAEPDDQDEAPDCAMLKLVFEWKVCKRTAINSGMRSSKRRSPLKFNLILHTVKCGHSQVSEHCITPSHLSCPCCGLSSC